MFGKSLRDDRVKNYGFFRRNDFIGVFNRFKIVTVILNLIYSNEAKSFGKCPCMSDIQLVNQEKRLKYKNESLTVNVHENSRTVKIKRENMQR